MAEALVWNIAIQGCCQPVAALFVAGVVCPAISVVIFTGKEIICFNYNNSYTFFIRKKNMVAKVTQNFLIQKK